MKVLLNLSVEAVGKKKRRKDVIPFTFSPYKKEKKVQLS